MSTIVCSQVVLAAISSFPAMAEDSQTAKFLSATKEGQISYVTASLAMAAVLSPPSQSKCIADYSQSNSSKGYPEILTAIQKYSEHHPTGVIAAVLERNCGKFEMAKH